MCCNPVTIRNPKYKNNTFIRSVDKEFLNVPCGHCVECQKVQQNDLIVRSYYEYLDCVSSGGFALFDTLTFTDLSCPEFNGFRYFSRDVLQKFLKRLTRKLEYDGFDVRNGHLKWLITTEYGSHTFRPHAHVIFFSHVFGLSPESLNEYIIRSWKDVDNSCPIGYNDNRDVQLRVINSVYGIRYVCKYVCKDSSLIDCLKYHSDSELSIYYRNYCINNNISLDSLSYSSIRQVFESYRYTHDVPKDFSFFNFNIISHGLGLSFFNNISLDDLLNDIVIYDSSDKQYTIYNVPKYYIRKAFYTYRNDTKQYRPNEYTSLLVNENYKKQYQSLLDNQLSLDDIYNVFSEHQRKSISKKFGIDDSVSSYRSFVENKLNGRTFEHFAKYVVYLRGLHCTPYLDFIYDGQLSILDDSFIQCICDYRNNASLCGVPPYRTDLFNPHPEVNITDDYHTNYMFNHLPEFVGYDDICEFISCLKKYYKLAKQKRFEFNRDQFEKYHSMLKKRLSSRILFN